MSQVIKSFQKRKGLPAAQEAPSYYSNCMDVLIQIFPSFLRIFSGVIGQLSIQTPQASWIAIPMAGAAPLHAISEIDLAPNGPYSSFTSISTA